MNVDKKKMLHGRKHPDSIVRGFKYKNITKLFNCLTAYNTEFTSLAWILWLKLWRNVEFSKWFAVCYALQVTKFKPPV